MKATENPMKETNKLKESRDFWMQLAKIQAETMRIMTDYLAEMNKSKSYKASDEVIEEIWQTIWRK